MRGLFADYDQLRRFFYLFFLKTPRAEEVLAADGMAFLDRLWADWCPGYDATEDLANVKRSLRDPRNLSAAIGYYRAEEPDLGKGAGPYAAETEALLRTPPQPTLYVHGELDGCIGAAMVLDSERHLAPGSQLAILPGCGHFPQVEQPRPVNELVLSWLGAGSTA